LWDLVLPITGCRFALVGFYLFRFQLAVFWAEAAAHLHMVHLLGLELCLPRPRQRFMGMLRYLPFEEDAKRN
jgi:hypothetical protein